MPKIQYRDCNFKGERLAIIDQANDIIATYRAQGYIRPIPPYRHLRTAGTDAHVIQNPALAKQTGNGLQPPARGEATSGRSAT